MSHPLLADAPGDAHLLLGNEAIVRGALEAGINMVTCYPGTPSSEVPDTFYRLRGSGRFTMEYSVNEKVALEVGAGACLAGAMTLVTMKHVGVNVAADPLFTLAYTGSPGGLVLLSADDPGCHSSQDEQDNRYYALMAGLPCFEPATAQEAKDMTREALLLSRRFEQPVLLRTTTRVNHLRGSVTYGPLPNPATIKDFQKNPMRFVPVPAVARVRHGVQLQNLEAIREENEKSPWNKISGQGRLGVITSGISRTYVHDALLKPELEGRFKILELGVTWPLPEKLIAEFLRDLDRVLVVEELEPFLETQVRALVQRLGLDVEICGKNHIFTRLGEYSTSLVATGLADFAGLSLPAAKIAEPEKLPGRPPTLCAGYSHRAVYFAVRQVFGDDAVYSSDIGCYTLGMAPPLKTADFLYCMGSSISAGSGFARFSDKPVLAFIGDSTFFHSGITGLANAVYNKHNIIFVILDNGTTAMTGHQPNPGVQEEVLGDGCLQLDIEALVRACGVCQVATVKGYNTKAVAAALTEMKNLDGVRVIIAREPCVLFARRALKKDMPQRAYVAEQGECVDRCLSGLGCPAFVRYEAEAGVDEDMCNGCMVCVQLSPRIKARKRSS